MPGRTASHSSHVYKAPSTVLCFRFLQEVTRKGKGEKKEKCSNGNVSRVLGQVRGNILTRDIHMFQRRKAFGRLLI